MTRLPTTGVLASSEAQVQVRVATAAGWQWGAFGMRSLVCTSLFSAAQGHVGDDAWYVFAVYTHHATHLVCSLDAVELLGMVLRELCIQLCPKKRS